MRCRCRKPELVDMALDNKPIKWADLPSMGQKLKEHLSRKPHPARLVGNDGLQANQDKAFRHAMLSKSIKNPLPQARWEAAPLALALSDHFDATHLFERGCYRRLGVGEDVLKKLQRGTWRLQGVCDLHDLRVDEARTALASHIQHCLRKGWRATLVIHGQGFGSKSGGSVLKNKVPHWLAQIDEVSAFAPAGLDAGGAGALAVLLR